jgi:hypothetical protein
MDTIFIIGEDLEENVKLNIDDLYERKKQYDLNTLAVYNRVLNRIHQRIKTISRQQTNEQYCWYILPEMIIGVPRFDNGACTAYVLDKLKDNGFIVRYTHPNMLLISWAHWVPAYVRQEIKKKTGVIVDGYGQVIDKTGGGDESGGQVSTDPNSLMFHHRSSNKTTVEADKGKEYKAIDTYIPSGKLIYNQDLMKKIEDRTRPN